MGALLEGPGLAEDQDAFGTGRAAVDGADEVLGGIRGRIAGRLGELPPVLPLGVGP